MEEIDYKIRLASSEDAAAIKQIMTAAFSGYLEEIHNDYKLLALTETTPEIIKDISCKVVYVAERADGKIIGSIRIKSLTSELAYICRFGVLPEIKQIGVGSQLLQAACDYCLTSGFKAVALHTNTRFYSLARYYYGKQFFVHSTTTDRGYIRALFVKELTSDRNYDLSPAMKE